LILQIPGKHEMKENGQVACLEAERGTTKTTTDRSYCLKMDNLILSQYVQARKTLHIEQ
jgi:hypothetical protein